jgi:hypothetical protein
MHVQAAAHLDELNMYGTAGLRRGCQGAGIKRLFTMSSGAPPWVFKLYIAFSRLCDQNLYYDELGNTRWGRCSSRYP